MRKEVQVTDSRMGGAGVSSPVQWQPNRSHYMHRFLHLGMVLHSNLPREDHFNR